MTYQHIKISPIPTDLDTVLTAEHAEAVRRETTLANAAPGLLSALKAIAPYLEAGEALLANAAIKSAQ